jgi:hypothetical protein
MKQTREPLTRRERELSDAILNAVTDTIKTHPTLDWGSLLKAMYHAAGIVRAAALADREPHADSFPPAA